MDTLTSIKVFRQVVELRSLIKASEKLNLSTAVVGKHVRHIEQRLGVRVLIRNGRTLRLTEAGKVYFERCKTILDDLDRTELELASPNAIPSGALRITCPSWFAGRRLADLLAGFHRRFPKVVVDMSFQDRIVDLVDESYDLALHIAEAAGSMPAGVVARPLRSVAFYLAASRDYLARNGAPMTVEDLSHHDFVAVGGQGSLTLMRPDGALEVPIRVALRYRSIRGVVDAVAAGIGIAPLPETFFEDPLYKCVLVPVLLNYPLRRATLYIVYVSRRYVPLTLRSFIDFAVASIPQATVPKPGARTG